MTILKTALLAIAVTGGVVATAQSSTETTPLSPARMATEKPLKGTTGNEYIIPTKKLMSFFKTGEIHADFPMYDTNLTKEENKAIARDWAAAHKELLTDEAIAKFEL